MIYLSNNCTLASDYVESSTLFKYIFVMIVDVFWCKIVILNWTS